MEKRERASYVQVEIMEILGLFKSLGRALTSIDKNEIEPTFKAHSSITHIGKALCTITLSFTGDHYIEIKND